MNFLFLESSRNWGGQEYRTCLEVNWLNAHGHQAWFGCAKEGAVANKARELGTRMVPFHFHRRIDPVSSFRLWRFCRRSRIDLVKTYSSKDHWLALPLYWSGIPLIRSRCITGRIEGGRRAFIYRNGCSRIVVDAAVIKRQLVADKIVPAQKIEVIGSAVDLTRFRPGLDGSKFRREFGIPNEAPLIVNVGMIRPDKGQVVLIEAASIILRAFPEARFAFAGEGTGLRKLGPKVREAIEREGIGERILLLGYRWDVPEIMAAANLIAIASLHTEASPIVLREALACGRALVATGVGDVEEVIRDREHGLIVEPGSPRALADAICELLRNPELATQLAQNGLRLAREKFSFDYMMQQKLEVDRRLVNRFYSSD